MQGPPLLSPDGAYWWDGQQWQPMPPGAAAAPVAQRVPAEARPSWLPQEVEVPQPPEPPGLPLIPPTATGASFGAPPGPWEPQPQPVDTSRSITRTVLVWVGLALSGGLLLFGLAGVAIGLGESGNTRFDTITGAAVLIVLAGSVFLPCLGTVAGFGPVVSASLHSLGILGCIVVMATVVNTAVAVTSPVGVGRYAVPWGTVVLVVFRAWRGRWLGAGIIVGAWMVGTALILTLARP
jgi:hypothetical protein